MSHRNGEDTAFVSIAVIDRLIEVLQLRNVYDPQPDRKLAIGDLEAVRKLIVDCAYPDSGDSDESVRVLLLLEQLGMMETSSLGTVPARNQRASATAANIADILARHEELSFGQSHRPAGRHVLPPSRQLPPAPAT